MTKYWLLFSATVIVGSLSIGSLILALLLQTTIQMIIFLVSGLALFATFLILKHISEHQFENYLNEQIRRIKKEITNREGPKPH